MSSVTPVTGGQRSVDNDHRWLILVIVAVAQLMVVLDATVVNIALPSAQRALGFPNSDRQWVVTAYALAFGVFGSVAGGGGAVGLILGGVLTQYFSWRWTLYVNLFFAAIAIAGALVYMQSNRPDSRPRLDWAGTMLASAGVFGIVFGFSRAEIAGWTGPGAAPTSRSG